LHPSPRLLSAPALGRRFFRPDLALRATENGNLSLGLMWPLCLCQKVNLAPSFKAKGGPDERSTRWSCGRVSMDQRGLIGRFRHIFQNPSLTVDDHGLILQGQFLTTSIMTAHD